jgi:hypothetical protein
MRWDKGKSSAQKYRERLDKKKQWNDWFAWHPVTVGNKRVWLEFLERKGEGSMVTESGTVYFRYEYKFYTDP